MTHRQHLAFVCEGSRLVATLDQAPGRTALLLVSGGNETRGGAWNGQAQLAARVAAAGWPVLRFDRRGVGDSEGENGEFRSSGPDIAAAIEALRRHCPHVSHIVGFGNCDAAAALMLAGGTGCDALVLSNPWTIEDTDADPLPTQVTRAHYRQRLRDPAALKRLLTGKVGLTALARSLLGLLPRPARNREEPSLLRDLKRGIAGFTGPVRFLVAERDRTGQTFLARWDKADRRLRICPGATHSYVEPDAQEWLLREVIEALEATA